ncbi:MULTISPECIES: helix-turn-helix domain-containing protein [Halorussus]|uniref:helix-turn-helix domain-containing protein n=1 Tax=Halorussus TaxID=1070314 RepID=UPI0020A19967|nr:helix-turn-helix domain-containing protein [Halorussus vallis]USZ74521.1 helix-turn-helix domain-containing protein [Halorussus vallis]
MSLIVVAEIRHPDLALTPTVKAVDSVSIQVIPHSATDPETGLFFFLVESEADSFDAFEAALEADHTVTDWTNVTDSGGSRIYRMAHTPETKLISPKTTEVGGLMAEAESSDRGWTVTLHIPDRDGLASLVSYCRDEEISFDVANLYRRDEWTVNETAKLTEPQRETLLAAYEQGYFEEPRQTSLEGLAESLDVSPSAVGGRLRRGVFELIRTTLTDE